MGPSRSSSRLLGGPKRPDSLSADGRRWGFRSLDKFLVFLQLSPSGSAFLGPPWNRSRLGLAPSFSGSRLGSDLRQESCGSGPLIRANPASSCLGVFESLRGLLLSLFCFPINRLGRSPAEGLSSIGREADGLLPIASASSSRSFLNFSLWASCSLCFSSRFFFISQSLKLATIVFISLTLSFHLFNCRFICSSSILYFFSSIAWDFMSLNSLILTL